MARLKGRAKGTVDNKGRVSLSAKYRKLLPEELVLAKSPDKEFPALRLYTPDDFEQWVEDVMEAKGYKANNQDKDKFLDDYYQNAEDVHVDSIGRISISTELREYAGIKKDVIISGSRDYLLIRSIESWEASSQSSAQVSVYDDDSTT